MKTGSHKVQVNNKPACWRQLTLIETASTGFFCTPAKHVPDFCRTTWLNGLDSVMLGKTIKKLKTWLGTVPQNLFGTTLHISLTKFVDFFVFLTSLESFPFLYFLIVNVIFHTNVLVATRLRYVREISVFFF